MQRAELIAFIAGEDKYYCWLPKAREQRKHLVQMVNGIAD